MMQGRAGAGRRSELKAPRWLQGEEVTMTDAVEIRFRRINSRRHVMWLRAYSAR